MSDVGRASTHDGARATDQRQLRAVLSTFATGVAVLTVGGQQPHGMTVNAVSSLSLEPPLVLVCVAQRSRMQRLIRPGGAFALSILAAEQQPLAEYFARADRPVGAEQFARVRCRSGHTDAPLIADALAWLECVHWRRYDGGDHDIVVGKVVWSTRNFGRGPLLFYESGLRRFTLSGSLRPDGHSRTSF